MFNVFNELKTNIKFVCENYNKPNTPSALNDKIQVASLKVIGVLTEIFAAALIFGSVPCGFVAIPLGLSMFALGVVGFMVGEEYCSLSNKLHETCQLPESDNKAERKLIINVEAHVIPYGLLAGAVAGIATGILVNLMFRLSPAQSVRLP